MRKVHNNTIYEKPEMQIIELDEIVVTTASGDDPFLGEDDIFI